MKENYLPWLVDFDDFYKQKTLSERLAFLVRFAILAPSSHNSQPWRFAVRENTIELLPEPSRRLLASDSDDRQLFISLGCALENLLVAADYYHFETRVDYLPSDAPQIAARVFFEPRASSARDKDHLIFSIEKRRTNRQPYESMTPSPLFEKWLGEQSIDGMRLDLIARDPMREHVAKLGLEAGIAIMDDDGFRRELANYVKPNTTDSKIGMPGFAFGMPLPASFLMKYAVRRFNVNRLKRSAERKILSHATPAFVAISGVRDDRGGWLRTGRLFDRIALKAHGLGMAIAPLMAVIAHSPSRLELQKLLQTDLLPQFLFRVGYPASVTPHTPRIKSEEVTSMRQ